MLNTLSKILLGFVVVAVIACLWFLLTQRNKGGSSSCSGNCAGCGMNCAQRQEPDKKE